MQLDSNHSNQFGDLENQKETLDIAVENLRNGKLIAYPTDTLYGLGCDAFNEIAVQEIFEVKQRPLGMPLPLIIGNYDQINLVTESITTTIEKLIESFWPGPLTLIVPSGPKVPAIVGSRGWKVGVRIPDHPIPRYLSSMLGNPIVGTSANISGMSETKTVNEVVNQIGNEVEMILKSNHKLKGMSSTILDITGSQPRILRNGYITANQIEEICNETVIMDI